jgi:hypothetical protein
MGRASLGELNQGPLRPSVSRAREGNTDRLDAFIAAATATPAAGVSPIRRQQ